MNLSGVNIFRRMFGLDYRSLALLRMALGTLVLCNLYVSAWSLRALYTDEGVLTRYMALAIEERAFSLFMANGSVWFAVTLFVIEAALALLMIVGYRTRAVTIASYVMLVSFQGRNPLLDFGSDIALRVCFFWAMFLPLNRRFSLDVLWGRVAPPEDDSYARIPGFAYIAQFSFIYIFSGILKTGPTWVVDHSAVAYALSLEVFRRPLGAWLAQYDSLTAAMTIATPYVEIYGPLLFISPVWSGWARLAACVIFAALQVGFNLTLQLGLFGAVMVGAMVALLPAEFWTHFAEPLGRRLRGLFRQWPGGPGETRAQRQLRDGALFWRRSRTAGLLVVDGVALFLIVYVTMWNLDTIPGKSRWLPPETWWIGTTTGLDQMFDLFTPDPSPEDGWFVIAGELENGERVNAFSGERSISYDRPADIAATYVDQRWGAYLICLWSADCSYNLEPFAKYLAREWNRDHTGPERMVRIEITFMREYVGPNHTRTEPVPNMLWMGSVN